jgi:hypothetical protein
MSFPSSETEGEAVGLVLVVDTERVRGVLAGEEKLRRTVTNRRGKRGRGGGGSPRGGRWRRGRLGEVGGRQRRRRRSSGRAFDVGKKRGRTARRRRPPGPLLALRGRRGRLRSSWRVEEVGHGGVQSETSSGLCAIATAERGEELSCGGDGRIRVRVFAGHGAAK